MLNAGRRPSAIALLVVALFGSDASAQSVALPDRGLTRVPAPVGPRGATQELYTGSYALLIGVSRYDTPAAWSRLDSIPDELNALADALRGAGFDRVEQLLNPSGGELRRGVEDFIRRYGYVPGHRVLFFFAGHGYTLDSGSRGYFVPRDAPDPTTEETAFRGIALSMDLVATWARDLVARHAMFTFDSCFSGTIFRTRDRAIPKRVSEATSKPVREFLSAGDAGEPVPARSVFTPVFIRGISGAADLDQDGYVTGTELGNFVQREVIAYKTGQAPQFGKLRDPRFDEGDIVFAVPVPPPAPDGTRLDLRWGLAAISLDDRADLKPHAHPLRRDLGLGFLFDNQSGILWMAESLHVTTQLQARAAGRDVARTSLRPVRRIAYLNLQRVANESALGKSSTASLMATRNKYATALQNRTKSAAELEKLRAEADAAVADAQSRLQDQFMAALNPVIALFCNRASIDVLFSAADSGLVYAASALDITAALIGYFDAIATDATNAEKIRPPTPQVPMLRRAAYLSVQRIATRTILGRQSSAQIAALRQKQQLDSEVTALQASLEESFRKKLQAVIDRYCSEHGIDIILDEGQGSISADASLDITEAIVRAFDATYPR